MAKGRKNQKRETEVEIVAPVEQMEETMNVATVEEPAAEEMEAVAADEIENTLDDGEDEDTAETESANGEKVRKPRGKRQIIFNCAANVTLREDIAERNLKAGETALMLEQVSVTMPGDNMEFDVAKGRAEAIEIFNKKYDVAPEMVLGPYYIRKGISSAPRKRETINVTVAKEAPFTAERGRAIHRFKDLDWNVLVNFTEKSDTVFVFYDTLVDPKQAPKGADKAKFQKPTPKFLPITALRNLQKNETVSA